MIGQLDGRVALVTGAGAGIGKATALGLLDRGAHVVALDVDGDRLEGLASENGERLTAVRFDLAECGAIPALVARLLSEHRRIDALINVAGIPGRISLASPVLDYDDGDWDRVFAVNLKAPFLLTKYVGRHMVERGGGGRIVFVSSSSAFRARHLSNAAYPCAKAGLSALARAAAGELGAHDVNVNTVAPGLTATSIFEDGRTADDLARAAVEGPMANLLRRPSSPEDVAAVIVFLCLPASRQITGQTIHTSAGAIV
jgi:NAD(P)-dependent dehydrogenase (short-subunit alcohol dehydrogenase family)